MSTRRRRHAYRTLVGPALAVVALLLSHGAASAHRERPVGFPDGTGSVPESECAGRGFEHRVARSPDGVVTARTTHGP